MIVSRVDAAADDEQVSGGDGGGDDARTAKPFKSGDSYTVKHDEDGKPRQ